MNDSVRFVCLNCWYLINNFYYYVVNACFYRFESRIVDQSPSLSRRGRLPVFEFEIGVPVGLNERALSVSLESKHFEREEKTYANESLPFRLVQVIEYLHVVFVELDDLQVVDDSFLSDRFRKNDDSSLHCETRNR